MYTRVNDIAKHRERARSTDPNHPNQYNFKEEKRSEAEVIKHVGNKQSKQESIMNLKVVGINERDRSG